jgi:N-methylhydantoinase A/oxoprolinase/acetone carboxylase beta subunit
MSDKRATARMAADIGGTFTDLVIIAGEQRFVAKVLPTPRARKEPSSPPLVLALARQFGHRALHAGVYPLSDK